MLAVMSEPKPPQSSQVAPMDDPGALLLGTPVEQSRRMQGKSFTDYVDGDLGTTTQRFAAEAGLFRRRRRIRLWIAATVCAALAGAALMWWLW
jgi:hypothetical protein